MIKRGLNKRGQFYLLAGIVIIAGIVGFATVNNYVSRSGKVRVQNIGEELGIEGGEVLDHGIYNSFNNEKMDDLVEDFTMNYSNYIGGESDIYFIYGNQEEVSISSYEEIAIGSMSVNLDGAKVTSQDISQGKFKGKKFEREKGEEDVEVEIAGVSHKFKLKPGHNFYFVLSHKRDGERHVITNKGGDDD